VIATTKRERREAGRARRRALVRRLTPKERRRSWLLARRSSGERAFIAGAALGLLGLIWCLVDPLSLRIAFSLLLIVALPVLVTMAFDRKV
jgi:hypothetical protein